MAELKKVMRPEIEIEYKGVFGFLYALFCVVKIGIKRCVINIDILGFEKYGQNAIQKQVFYVIPKYTFKKMQGGG